MAAESVPPLRAVFCTVPPARSPNSACQPAEAFVALKTISYCFYNEKSLQVVILGGLCKSFWSSWGELNPRPQAIPAQFYMCSRLI